MKESWGGKWNSSLQRGKDKCNLELPVWTPEGHGCLWKWEMAWVQNRRRWTVYKKNLNLHIPSQTLQLWWLLTFTEHCGVALWRAWFKWNLGSGTLGQGVNENRELSTNECTDCANVSIPAPHLPPRITHGQGYTIIYNDWQIEKTSKWNSETIIINSRENVVWEIVFIIHHLATNNI